MNTRRSWKNQDRLFAYLFKPESFTQPKKTKQERRKKICAAHAQGHEIREDYVPHYHQDDSGIFECLLGSDCKYIETEPRGFTKPDGDTL